MDKNDAYILERQVGFVMRRAVQRHIAIFSALIPEMTPTQFAALAKLSELGQASQNELGRLTSMDVATIKGVVDRLRARELIRSRERSLSTTPLIVATSIDVSLPSSFCDAWPSSHSLASAANWVGVISGIRAEKMAMCRCTARRMMKPT